jgi:hypothetical protein
MKSAYAEHKQSREWKQEKRFQIETQIKIQIAMLKNLRTELAEINHLYGTPLLDRFRCESPEDLEKLFQGKREFLDQLTDVWVSAEYRRKAS